MTRVVRAAICLTLPPLLATCAATTRCPREPVGSSLTIVTYNINWGFPSPKRALSAIRESNADIVLLQETNESWEAFLTPRLEATYPHSRFRHSRGAGGQAVFSRTPFRERAWKVGGDGWFPSWVLEVDTELGPIQVAGVHFRPPLSDEGSVSLSSYFGAGNVHEGEMRALHAKLDPSLPTIVAGDFNEADDGRALSFLSELGFTNALPLFDRSTDTWHWPTSIVTLSDRYDHVLFSRHFECASARVIERGDSDHRPVVAVLEVHRR